MFQAVVFDMDDTLIQTKKVKISAHRFAAKKFYNLDLTDADVEKHWGLPLSQMMRGMYGGVDAVETIISNYYSINAAFPIPAYDGAIEAVTEIAKHCHTGLLTSATKRLMEAALSDSGFKMDMFSYIQSSDDTRAYKPDPQVFDPLLDFFRKKGIGKSGIVYIGDSVVDYQAAHGAGINFIGIAGHTTEAVKFREVGAKTVSCLKELSSKLSYA